VPHFADGKVGLVQARWEHLNLEQNLLTRVQSFLIDGHFILESTYRHRTGRFFNFNGTGGIWRRSCIDDAGGWSSASIAEDTELSIRAYLRGWKFTYLRDLMVPAELPADVTAYKSQQHRWAKGYTEIFLQQSGRIWASNLKWWQKLEAMLMLSNHLAFLIFGALTILHLPLVLVRSSFRAAPILVFLDVLGINLILLAFFAFYVVSQWDAGRLGLRRLAHVPLVLGLGMASMVNSSRGVLEALFRTKSGFVRTPKAGDRPDPAYRADAALWQAFVEVAFGVYLLASCVLLIARGQVWGAPLNLLVGSGFLYLGLGTLRAQWQPVPAPLPPIAPPVEPESEPEPLSAPR
jgi:Glycosyl transferase family group 2